MKYVAIFLIGLTVGCHTAPYGAREEGGPPAAPAGTVSAPTLVTREAPDFTAQCVMPDNTFQNVTLSSYKGRYVVLFFYPMDFTFVCPTEIIAFNEYLEEFKARDCEIIGVSVDSVYTHLAWKSVPAKEGGIGKIRYPIASDITKKIASSYGVLHQDSVALRGLFLIDREGKVRHALVNDLPLGRNVEEALRTLDALQVVDAYGMVCPANWSAGKKTVEPTKEGIKKYLSDQNL